MSLAELADRVGRYFCIRAGMESEIGKISYGVECAFVLLLSLAAVLTAGCLAGVPGETAVVAVALLIIKTIIGGPHLSGFFRCIVYSSVYIVGTAIVLKLVRNIHFSTWVLAMILLSGASVVLLYVPLLREGITLANRQIWQRKIIALLFLVISTVLNCFTTDYRLRGVLFGIVLALINVTPLGVGWVNFLECITKRKGGE